MIKVDENTCIGCGACTYVDSDTFAMNDKGVSTAISQEVTEKAEEAVAACPVGAITIEEDQEAELQQAA